MTGFRQTSWYLCEPICWYRPIETQSFYLRYTNTSSSYRYNPRCRLLYPSR